MKATAKSSLGQIPAIHRWITNTQSKSVFDFGAGKQGKTDTLYHNLATSYFPHDPYNRTKEENIEAEKNLALGLCDILVCSNVLNVIPSNSLTESLCKIKTLTHSTNDKTAYISVYYDSKLEKNRRTRYGGFQRNEPLSWYENKLNLFFDSVKKEKGFLICKLF